MLSMDKDQIWRRNECAVFCKVKAQFGEFGNMAGGFHLQVPTLGGGYMLVTSSEALYQALGFPHLPLVQRAILTANGGFAAKLVMKPHKEQRRPDWEEVKVPIMRWCLQLKLAQYRWKLAAAIASAGDRPLVELSMKDNFWGAIPLDGFSLRGANMLGRLWMEVIAAADAPFTPPPITDLRLLDIPLTEVSP